MSTAPPSAGPAPLSGLVRVTVASGSRRVDLVLPGAVPVAELVPELARSVGLLDPLTVHGGYTVTGPDGRRLSGDAGLVLQGVEDGALLTVSAGVDAEPPRVYDDVVEAMTDVVERDLRPWSPASGRRTALGAAGLLLVLGAASLLLQTTTVDHLLLEVFALLLRVLNIDIEELLPLLESRTGALVLRWARSVSDILELVSGGAGCVCENVAGEEDDIGDQAVEDVVRDEEVAELADRAKCLLAILAHLTLAGSVGGWVGHFKVDLGVRGVVDEFLQL